MGIFWKAARIGERLSPYISLCCVFMAVRFRQACLVDLLYPAGEHKASYLAERWKELTQWVDTLGLTCYRHLIRGLTLADMISTK